MRLSPVSHAPSKPTVTAHCALNHPKNGPVTVICETFAPAALGAQRRYSRYRPVAGRLQVAVTGCRTDAGYRLHTCLRRKVCDPCPNCSPLVPGPKTVTPLAQTMGHILGQKMDRMVRDILTAFTARG